ncbi:hypothetical protein PoB_001281300 [Plakobranchus ocellatus]|uniref:Uncharacterized protein n=1 Tax=Plakobranchus ocellatus TaxID=259542 RepID=A0AAV3YVB1_9GAST|nr:hypothetical protein PoB_001281300 [Plakobranchus ocellatus]
MCNNPDLLSQCRTLISITVHSVVAFDRYPEGQLHRHSITMLTGDAAHDHLTIEPSAPCKVYHCGQLQMDVHVYSMKTIMLWQSHS